jgi:hypothetical protein
VSEERPVLSPTRRGRGERGTLVVSIDALHRMSSNLFFPYVLERGPRMNELEASVKLG